MAFFPDVSKNDAFVPSALLSNNVRHLINSMNGFRGGKMAGAFPGMIRIQVCNRTEQPISAGSAVNFDESGEKCGEAVPVITFADGARPWGVIPCTLNPKDMGDCVVSGPVEVSLAGDGARAVPSSENPAVFQRSENGASILFAAGGKGLILLGAGTMDTLPFQLSISDGRLFVSPGVVFFNENGGQNSLVHVRTVDSDGVAVPDIDLRAVASGEYAVLCAAITPDLNGAVLRFYLIPVDNAGNSGVRLPGFAGMYLGRISMAGEIGEERTYVVTKQIVRDNICLSIDEGLLRFRFAVAQDAEASKTISAWSQVEFSFVGVHDTSIGYDADPARSIDHFIYSGSPSVPNGISGIYLKCLETITRDAENGTISRTFAANGVAVESSATEPPDLKYEVSAPTADATTARVVHHILLGTIVRSASAPPNYTPAALPPLKIGGYHPEEWSGAGGAGTKLYLLQVTASGNPAQVNFWNSFASMSAGDAPGTGALYLLGSNFSDPISAGDMLYGNSEDGIVNYREYGADNTTLIRNWIFSVSRPFDCEGADPAPIYTCGGLYLYKSDSVWRISSNFGCAKVDDTTGAVVPSGYNGAHYYTIGGNFLWKYEGRWVLTGSLGGGMEAEDSWWREDTAGTLTHQGAATVDKTLAFGHSGLEIQSDSETPPSGNWQDADMGDEGLEDGQRFFSAVPESGMVFVADKRSFL